MRSRSKVTAPGAVMMPLSWLNVAVSALTMKPSLAVNCTPPAELERFLIFARPALRGR